MKKDKINNGICKCGHHSKDHSYNPYFISGYLECDVCNCADYQFYKFEDEIK